MKLPSWLVYLFVAVGLYLAINIMALEKRRRIVKEDLIELSKVKYGIFSVDEWKNLLSTIITKKINEFDLSQSNNAALRKSIFDFLTKAINDFEKRFYEQNSNTFKGFIKGSFAHLFGAFDEVKKDVPRFTDDVLRFLEDPRNRKALREYLLEKLDNYTGETFAAIDYREHDRILAKYKCKDRPGCIIALKSRSDELGARTEPYRILLLSLVGLSVGYLFIKKDLAKSELAILTALCFVLLYAGLFLPMIEIDARISQMSFSLLGEKVRFSDQVLYYKSKSILEVVSVMISQSRIDLLLVGMLVFVFSVLFPISKLTASILFLYRQKSRSNKIVSFLVFKTGKWSMADVMVIAIFMSYIGFSGIITEQLKQIEQLTSGVEVLTTNKSNLLIGFYCFTSFAFLSLLISHKLQFSQADTFSR